MRHSCLQSLCVGILVLLGWLALGPTPQVIADEPVAIGGYAVSAQWRDDPAKVQQPNAVILVFSREELSTAAPEISELRFALVQGEARTLLTVATDAQGTLTASCTPTAVGPASVAVTGSLDGVDVAVSLPLPDVSPQTVVLPAIGVEALAVLGEAEDPGPNWVMIGGIGLAAAMLAMAVLLGRGRE